MSRNINVSVQNTGKLQYITGDFKDWMTFLKPPAQSLMCPVSSLPEWSALFVHLFSSEMFSRHYYSLIKNNGETIFSRIIDTNCIIQYVYW